MSKAKPVKLKPCPFCGSLKVVFSRHWRAFQCSGCYCIGPFKDEIIGKGKRAHSLKIWNTRRSPK